MIAELALVATLHADSKACHEFLAGHTVSVTDTRFTDTYLRTDLRLLASDIKRHAHREVIQTDRYYVWLDCTQTGDE